MHAAAEGEPALILAQHVDELSVRRLFLHVLREKCRKQTLGQAAQDIMLAHDVDVCDWVAHQAAREHLGIAHLLVTKVLEGTYRAHAQQELLLGLLLARHGREGLVYSSRLRLRFCLVGLRPQRLCGLLQRHGLVRCGPQLAPKCLALAWLARFAAPVGDLGLHLGPLLLLKRRSPAKNLLCKLGSILHAFPSGRPGVPQKGGRQSLVPVHPLHLEDRLRQVCCSLSVCDRGVWLLASLGLCNFAPHPRVRCPWPSRLLPVHVHQLQHGQGAGAHEDHALHRLALTHHQLVPVEAPLVEAVGHGRQVRGGHRALLKSLLNQGALPEEFDSLLDEKLVELARIFLVVCPGDDQCLCPLTGLNGRRSGLVLLQRQFSKAAALGQEHRGLQRPVLAGAPSFMDAIWARGVQRRHLDTDTAREDDVVFIPNVAHFEDVHARLEGLKAHHLAQGALLQRGQRLEELHVTHKLQDVVDIFLTSKIRGEPARLADGIQPCSHAASGPKPQGRATGA
mmetsp:Transcript_98827/g.235596  ORF Transcript_98827/g.235596 Transcript_98827/m.235596 type:complete len:509 (-) Transcript_98827:36-1562(-)